MVLVGFVLVMVFMGLSYGLFGWIVNVVLMLNMVMVFGVLLVLGVMLILLGIVGIVLIMGMVVDVNVLVYECICEEFKIVKGFVCVIEFGYEWVLLVILDVNVIIFIMVVILWFVGFGFVWGFVMILGIGIVILVIIVLFVICLFIVWWFGWCCLKKIEV